VNERLKTLLNPISPIIYFYIEGHLKIWIFFFLKNHERLYFDATSTVYIIPVFFSIQTLEFLYIKCYIYRIKKKV
jgi:hypothetical protein